MAKILSRKQLVVYADWSGLPGPHLMGILAVVPGRGREIFSFEYDKGWLASP